MSDKLWYNPCAKGPILYCLDEVSKREDARGVLDGLKSAIEALAGSEYAELQDAFRDALFKPAGHSAQKSQEFADSLKKHWFDENSAGAYFKEFQPIAPVYAAGVLKTLELSLAPSGSPKPIDAWWITGFSQVRFFNLVSEHQITFLIATPMTDVVIQKVIMGTTGKAWMTSRHGIASGEAGPAG